MAESRRELGLPAGRVAKEQHVRAVGHGDQDGQRAGNLLGADGYQDQVIPVAHRHLAHHGHRQHGAVPRLCVLQYQGMRPQV